MSFIVHCYVIKCSPLTRLNLTVIHKAHLKQLKLTKVLYGYTAIKNIQIKKKKIVIQNWIQHSKVTNIENSVRKM